MPATHHTETDTSQISRLILARRNTETQRNLGTGIPIETRSMAEIGASLNHIGAAINCQMTIVQVPEIDEMTIKCKEVTDQAQEDQGIGMITRQGRLKSQRFIIPRAALRILLTIRGSSE